MSARFHLRRASLRDADAIAAVFSPSLRSLGFLPDLHTVEEDRNFIGSVILRESEVTVAESKGEIVGFVAVQEIEVRLLHVHPAWFGQGAGSALIGAAKRSRNELELWCFQQNTGARRFYERHGFTAIASTEGEGNEEKLPDVRYRWTREIS